MKRPALIALRNKTAPAHFILLCALASSVVADEIKSVMITSQTGSITIHVSKDQFLNIDNFTQEGGSERGAVMVTKGGQTTNALNAAIIDQGPSPSPLPDISPTPEFIKNIRIAGPARIAIDPITGATLFITYKKYLEVPKATPTPTPTATPVPTSTPTPTPTPTPTATPVSAR